MKKKFLLVLLMIFIFPFAVKANTKVNVYIFEGEGCPHCAEAKEYFKDLKEDSNYSNKFELVEYEVWNDADNAKLMQKVSDKFEANANGVPFIIIGDKFFLGYTSRYNSDIENAINNAYENDSEDKVIDIINSDDEDEIEEPKETKEELTNGTDTYQKEDTKLIDTNKDEDDNSSKTTICIIIGGIFIVLLILSVIVFNKNK